MRLHLVSKVGPRVFSIKSTYSSTLELNSFTKDLLELLSKCSPELSLRSTIDLEETDA